MVKSSEPDAPLALTAPLPAASAASDGKDDWDPVFTVTSLGAGTASVPSLEVAVTEPDGNETVVPLGMVPLAVGTSGDCDVVVKDGHLRSDERRTPKVATLDGPGATP